MCVCISLLINISKYIDMFIYIYILWLNIFLFLNWFVVSSFIITGDSQIMQVKLLSLLVFSFRPRYSSKHIIWHYHLFQKGTFYCNAYEITIKGNSEEVYILLNLMRFVQK